METSDTAGGSWAQLVSPRYRRLVAISSLLFVFQQFAGINAVVFCGIGEGTHPCLMLTRVSPTPTYTG